MCRTIASSTREIRRRLLGYSSATSWTCNDPTRAFYLWPRSAGRSASAYALLRADVGALRAFCHGKIDLLYRRRARAHGIGRPLERLLEAAAYPPLYPELSNNDPCMHPRPAAYHEKKRPPPPKLLGAWMSMVAYTFHGYKEGRRQLPTRDALVCRTRGKESSTVRHGLSKLDGSDKKDIDTARPSHDAGPKTRSFDQKTGYGTAHNGGGLFKLDEYARL